MIQVLINQVVRYIGSFYSTYAFNDEVSPKFKLRVLCIFSIYACFVYFVSQTFDVHYLYLMLKLYFLTVPGTYIR